MQLAEVKQGRVDRFAEATAGAMVTAGGQTSHLSAMISGHIGATMLRQSGQVQLEPKGYKVLYDYTKQSPERYDDNLFAMKSWLTGTTRSPSK